jgi:hypothetical protein
MYVFDISISSSDYVKAATGAASKDMEMLGLVI